MNVSMFKGIQQLCKPAIIYLVFSISQILFDIYGQMYTLALVKFAVSFIITALLNYLCYSGFSNVSWILVFIPFMLMTVVVSILLLAVSINPNQSLQVNQNRNTSDSTIMFFKDLYDDMNIEYSEEFKKDKNINYSNQGKICNKQPETTYSDVPNTDTVVSTSIPISSKPSIINNTITDKTVKNNSNINITKTVTDTLEKVKNATSSEKHDDKVYQIDKAKQKHIFVN